MVVVGEVAVAVDVPVVVSLFLNQQRGLQSSQVLRTPRQELLDFRCGDHYIQTDIRTKIILEFQAELKSHIRSDGTSALIQRANKYDEKHLENTFLKII